MITETDPSTWPVLYIPLEKYLGYGIALQHFTLDQYKVNVTCPWDFTNIISDSEALLR